MSEALHLQARQARAACRPLAWSEGHVRESVLRTLAAELRSASDELLQANSADCQAAQEEGISSSMLDRLRLTPERVEGMARGCETVAALPDPLGREVAWTRPNGLLIRKVRVPLGLLCMVYEARPNVTIESASLAIRSGNGCLLRGSRSARHSNEALMQRVASSLEQHGLPGAALQGVADLSRDSVDVLARMNGVVDLIIPRGGAELIGRVVRTATVPVLETGVGVCHLYVHPAADLHMAVPVIINSKASRPSVCNSLETLLVDAAVAAPLFDALRPAIQQHGIQVLGDERTLALCPGAQPATADDWDGEFLDLRLAVRVVDGLDEALAHIAAHGSGHTECILTNDLAAARRFQREVDACTVNVNASTRFTDGGEFGFGAEIGISTQKMHARGPVGLDELTTSKFWVEGSGQIR